MEREKEIALWQEAEQLLNTDLGKYLSSKAEERQEAVKDDLVLVDPDDHETIAKLQREYHRFNDLFGWLREVIEQGQESYQDYLQDE